MRSRLAVLSLLTLAFAAIGTVPANASPAVQELQRIPIPAGGSVIDLDSNPQFYVTTKQASILRITSLQEHKLRVEIRPLPNPATFPTAGSFTARRVGSAASASSSRIGFDLSRYARESTDVPTAIPFPRSSATRRSRLTSGLRAAALVGTLVKGRHNRS